MAEQLQEQKAEEKDNVRKSRKPETHVSERKKKIVRDLIELMKKKSVMIVSIKNLPASQFQELRKKLRGKAEIKVAKKRLIDFALEHAKNDKLEELVKYVQENSAILFSDEDAFELSGFLSDNKTPAKAKIGQTAPSDIEIEAGPTDLPPGPDISALSSAGLQVKVDNGKIAIQESATIVKEGEEISEEKASILNKLDITPFEIGLEPIAAYMDNKIYTNIKIDKQGTIDDMLEKHSRALAFAVSISYPNKDTIGFILAKASSHENALSQLISGYGKEDEESEKNLTEKTEEENEEQSNDQTEGENLNEKKKEDNENESEGEKNE